jgi:hypothetical protein
MVIDWNCLKYFCVFLYCNHRVHSELLITLYIHTQDRIQTYNLNRQAASDAYVWPHDQWDRLLTVLYYRSILREESFSRSQERQFYLQPPKKRKAKFSFSKVCFEFWIQLGILAVQSFVTTWCIPAGLSLFESHLLRVTSRDQNFCNWSLTWFKDISYQSVLTSTLVVEI